MTLLFYAAISILFSFLCSIWEAVLLSITPGYVSAKVAEGSSIGTDLQNFKKDIDKPLSAILTLNTIAHTVGAMGVGAEAGKLFGSKSYKIPGLDQGISAESIIAAVMTLAILLLSEIIPKTLGANNWKGLAPFTVKSIKALMWVLTPFIWLSNLITKTFKKSEVHSVFSRADFLAMANVGKESGQLQETESNIIQNLFSLDQLKVQDVMTPRTVLHLCSEDMTLQEYYDSHKPFRFSRIPVFRDSPDDISGYVLKDEFLSQMIEGKQKEKLATFKRDIPVVKNSDTLDTVFTNLTNDQEHIAAVIDQYGSLVGLVSMEDLIETLLGLEITDETDKITDLQAYARKRWEDRAKRMGLIE